MLLPSRTQKFVDLINETHIQAVSIDYLLKKYKISFPTLERFVNELDKIIYPSYFILTTKELSLCLSRHHSSDSCIAKILQNSFEYNLLIKIFFNETYTISSLSEALFVSESTVKRTMKDINLNLTPLNFKISTKPLRVNGDETKLRHFFIIIIKEMYGLENLPFKKEDLDFIKDFYKQFHSIFGLPYSQQDLLNYQLFSLVALQRELNGHTISTPSKIVEERKALIDSISLDYPNVESNHYKGVPLCKIFYFLLSDGFYTPIKALNSTDSFTNQIHNFIEEIEYIFLYSYSEENKNIITKKIHEIVFGYLSMPDHYHTANNYYKKFFYHNDFFIEKMNSIFKLIFEKNFPNASQNSMYMLFFTMIVETDQLLSSFMKNIEPTKILIYFNFDPTFNMYIKNKLELTLSGKNEISILTGEHSFENIDVFFRNYDIIITNHFFDDFPSFENIITVSHFLSKTDNEKIKQMNDKITKEKFNRMSDEMYERANELIKPL
ncbi:helix-turn-helix domain-containing protein [Vagococcus zengguangii]|uniref:helix-turn-helix domain-containing protein n=1 Tax=Vagococcus zengguangii TaxID=2571750 RepID=UPI0011082963|nr:helix-turn-helix domain-containing protein [Vagococcus zengguangii]TLG79517.1 hypothetical protein FE258_08625 [Vagococcus zengguangii]